MLAFLGDIHGDASALKYQHDLARDAGACAVVQVGDFGFYAELRDRFASYRWQLPIYAIDGNHDDHAYLRGMAIDEPLEWVPGITYVPRGSVLELDGRTLACLGGAASIDKDYRIRNGWHWSPDEELARRDVRRLMVNLLFGPRPDLLVTHCPPQWLIKRYFDDPNPYRKCWDFGVPVDWFDPSADRVEAVWQSLGQPGVFCGHMHQSIVDSGVRVLDINELFLLE